MFGTGGISGSTWGIYYFKPKNVCKEQWSGKIVTKTDLEQLINQITQMINYIDHKFKKKKKIIMLVKPFSAWHVSLKNNSSYGFAQNLKLNDRDEKIQKL